MKSFRSLALAAIALGSLTTSQALATPFSYDVDIEVTFDNGFGLAPGTYAGAGTVTIDVPDAAPAGFSGATLLSFDVTLGADTWTLVDSTDGNYAGVLQDGAPVGVVFFGLNSDGHVISLGFNPEDLAVADITTPEANRFAIGSYSLSPSASATSAVPEPNAAMLFSLGVLTTLATLRRRAA